MKKLSVLFVSVLALGMSFVSCSKDDDKEASIEGKWNYSTAAITTNGIEVPFNDYIDNQANCAKDYLELKTAGVANSGEYSSDCKLTVDTGTWKKDGNKLTVVSDGESTSFEVVSVTDSTLKLKVSYSEGGVALTVIVTLVKA
ncbi:lipocalin family protein [Flavobacterium aestivum]|uniref:lipocalin family protein n=1 Tax=Flavobacterium aestivum TaxID=3003257 RepID=UPI002285AA55|nr:lipocalin family protein [Flavobacterium aestivum]